MRRILSDVAERGNVRGCVAMPDVKNMNVKREN